MTYFKTPDQEKAFNLACAEFMGYERIKGKWKEPIFHSNNGTVITFSPATDANDLNLVIEEIKIDVDYMTNIRVWRCSLPNNKQFKFNGWSDKDRTTAKLKCVVSVLGIGESDE